MYTFTAASTSPCYTLALSSILFQRDYNSKKFTVLAIFCAPSTIIFLDKSRHNVIINLLYCKLVLA